MGKLCELTGDLSPKQYEELLEEIKPLSISIDDIEEAFSELSCPRKKLVADMYTSYDILVFLIALGLVESRVSGKDVVVGDLMEVLWSVSPLHKSVVRIMKIKECSLKGPDPKGQCKECPGEVELDTTQGSHCYGYGIAPFITRYMKAFHETVQGDDMSKKRTRIIRRRNGGAMDTNTGFTSFHDVSQRETYWESNIKTITQCGVVSSDTKVVRVGTIPKQKIEFLMNKFKSKEWLAYLLGKKVDGGYLVEDLFFPEQEASSTRVEPKEYTDNPNVIGVIHSHHSMGHSFSGTDNDYINENHKISIVVSHSGYTGHIRKKTPCGCLIKVPITIQNVQTFNFDVKEFESHVDSKMKTKTYPVVRGGNYYDGLGYQGGRYDYLFDSGQFNRPQVTVANKDDQDKKSTEDVWESTMDGVILP